MFPPDTQTIATEITGVGSSTLSNTGGTLLYGEIQQSGVQSVSTILCDDTPILRSYGSHSDGFLNKYCNTISANKTGSTQDKGFFTILYIPRTSTSSYISPLMTYGDIALITFDYWIFGTIIAALLIGLTKVWRTRKNYD